MKRRKSFAGGRHLAFERGVRLNGGGWPVQRELRKLAARLRDAPQLGVPPAKPLGKEQKPCAA